VSPEEFIRRFLLHVLPHQFFKIRHYGLLAPANVNTRLARAQQRLGPLPTAPAHDATPPTSGKGDTDDGVARTTEHDADCAVPNDHVRDPTAPQCPHCGGTLRPIVKRNPRLQQVPPPDT